MRAIVVERLCEPEELELREWPAPAPGPGQLRVEVKAAGCNFSDILMCRGEYQRKPPLPFIPGGEMSGVVTELGSGVDDFAVGDRVFGTASGCFAEEVVADAGSVYAMPGAMGFADAAAIPITYPTSFAALVFRAQLREGETLLVHAAAGGVGLAAVQIGVALGARVIATAGGEEKLAFARDAGAEVLIDYRREDFVARVMEATSGRGADVIYDSVGGNTTDRSLKCIAWDGRHVVVGFAGGEIPSVKLNRVMLKNIAITGVHWPAYAEKAPERVAETFAGLLAMYVDGRIRPVIYGSFGLDGVSEALSALGSRKTHGKVLIEP